MVMGLRRLAGCGVLLAVAVAAGAQSEVTGGKGEVAGGRGEVAFARAGHLRRGVNLSMWYAQDGDLYNATGGAEKLASYIGRKDFELVKGLGFDHVRLSIDPVPLIADGAPMTLRPEAMARLDKTVGEITGTGLVVVLDVHPETAWKHEVMTEAGAGKLFAFWKSFARHYAGSDPEKVYFEVLNEPEGVDGSRWAGEQERAVEVIRGEAPRHTIVATGASWGSVAGLTAIEPVKDENVIYTFHDYLPMEFTHQGATWSSENLKGLRGVPYPSTPENVAPLLAGQSEAARKDLAWYGEQRWDAAMVAAKIAPAAEWAKRWHVPVWCGEFGVYKAYAPAADRARWLGDMRKALEAAGVGWDMWDYRGGFALVEVKGGVVKADAGVAEALGVGVKSDK